MERGSGEGKSAFLCRCLLWHIGHAVCVPERVCVHSCTIFRVVAQMNGTCHLSMHLVRVQQPPARPPLSRGVRGGGYFLAAILSSLFPSDNAKITHPSLGTHLEATGPNKPHPSPDTWIPETFRTWRTPSW